MNKIEECINDFVEKFLPKDFIFRKYQKEVIIDIINTFLEGEKKSYILEMPTGGGKSLVGIIASYVLNQHGKTGYILVSDLSLLKQYENDITRYKIHFPIVSGIDNYFCSENMEKHSLGECHIRNIPSNQIRNLSCYRNCEYYCRRDAAAAASTCILTYSYWLIQRNYVAKQVENEQFKIRDFIICDEAHKVTDIVQNHFSPSINIMTNSQLEKLRQFILSKEFGQVKVSSKKLSETIDNLFKENSTEKLFLILKDFEYQLSCFEEKADLIKEFIAKKYAFKSVPKEWRYGIYLCDWVKDMHCKFEDYNLIIDNTGLKSLIKNPGEEGVTFNCLDESYLMKKHFHDECGYELLMSATIGDPKNYMKNIKVPNARFIRVKSSFNFDKSPIYAFVGKKMSFSEKTDSLPWVIEKVKEIINIHKEDSGIIHTGSYALSRELYGSLSVEIRKRILFYTNSDEKKECLIEFYKKPGMVLIGPSILEGLDLYQDRSRFQIFMKTPYPSLMDKFVAAKLDNDQSWYNHKTSLAVLQGIGRSVRSQTDWAVSYILDGCFVDLFKRNQSAFPQEFKERLIWVQHNNMYWQNMKPVKLNT